MMMMIMMVMMIRASSRRAYLAQLHAFITSLGGVCIPFCCREKEEWRD